MLSSKVPPLPSGTAEFAEMPTAHIFPSYPAAAAAAPPSPTVLSDSGPHAPSPREHLPHSAHNQHWCSGWTASQLGVPPMTTEPASPPRTAGSETSLGLELPVSPYDEMVPVKVQAGMEIRTSAPSQTQAQAQAQAQAQNQPHPQSAPSQPLSSSEPAQHDSSEFVKDTHSFPPHQANPTASTNATTKPPTTAAAPNSPTCQTNKSSRRSNKTKLPLPRNFVCNVCGTAFARNHDLRRHCFIHKANKPHSCPNCFKKFSRKDALNRHLTVKTGCFRGRRDSLTAPLRSAHAMSIDLYEGQLGKLPQPLDKNGRPHVTDERPSTAPGPSSEALISPKNTSSTLSAPTAYDGAAHMTSYLHAGAGVQDHFSGFYSDLKPASVPRARAATVSAGSSLNDWKVRTQTQFTLGSELLDVGGLAPTPGDSFFTIPPSSASSSLTPLFSSSATSSMPLQFLPQEAEDGPRPSDLSWPSLVAGMP